MDGLKDYIEWLGDISFDAKPFGDVDAIILCLISYFDTEPGLLRDLLPGIEAGSYDLKITGGEQGTTAVFKAAASSERFGGLEVSDFVDVLDPEKDLQFSAVTFSYKDQFSFIAFRGTDNTLVGWKEDFMIAYTLTEAQRLAFEYARDAVDSDTTGRAWYIGGHSKGGNLALYAACSLPGTLLGRVRRVYDLDGPGFANDVVDDSLVARAEPYVTRIIPEKSIIGRIMEPKISDTRIIKSSNEGIMQHSIASWGVDHGRPAWSELSEPEDLWINDTIKQWIDGLSREETVSFIDEFFDALNSSGAKTVDDLMKAGRPGLEAVFEKLRSFSPNAKLAVSGLQAAAADNIVRRIQEAIPDAVLGTTKTVVDSTKKVLPMLQAAAERINIRGEKDREE